MDLGKEAILMFRGAAGRFAAGDVEVRIIRKVDHAQGLAVIKLAGVVHSRFGRVLLSRVVVEISRVVFLVCCCRIERQGFKISPHARTRFVTVMIFGFFICLIVHYVYFPFCRSFYRCSILHCWFLFYILHARFGLTCETIFFPLPLTVFIFVLQLVIRFLLQTDTNHNTFLCQEPICHLFQKIPMAVSPILFLFLLILGAVCHSLEFPISHLFIHEAVHHGRRFLIGQLFTHETVYHGLRFYIAQSTARLQ
mmetsp:Transcript_28957/g.66296  ORF Transcript_28957/g.66296 Transcript_28957/m.66296 type:complete len:252 (-) Transcript_28957:172-927(-)